MGNPFHPSTNSIPDVETHPSSAGVPAWTSGPYRCQYQAADPAATAVAAIPAAFSRAGEEKASAEPLVEVAFLCKLSSQSPVPQRRKPFVIQFLRSCHCAVEAYVGCVGGEGGDGCPLTLMLCWTGVLIARVAPLKHVRENIVVSLGRKNVRIGRVRSWSYLSRASLKWCAAAEMSGRVSRLRVCLLPLIFRVKSTIPSQ